MSTTTKRLLTVEETAAYLGLSKLTVYDWVSQRKIEHVKIGRLVKFDPRVLDRWIDQHTVKPRSSAHGTDQAA
ncbi:MAG: helix-turn-helix domain-containing protein [Nitrospira sp.]|nr:helix-turn-helix domain-containing protein [Nitrospira sp.]